jgi:subtilisin family serine protease
VAVHFPAKLRMVIGVGAVDSTNTIADFSSRGNGLEIVGPGVQVPVALVQDTAVDSALSVTSPAGVGPYANAAIEFSAVGAASGELVFVGTGTVDEVAGLDLSGKIALIQRGSISFAEKVANAADAGAEAALIFNNVPGAFSGTLGAPAAIPAIALTGEDGLDLAAHVEAGTVGVSVEVALTDWASWDGTSFSAPHVAGVAALLLSVDPDLTPAQVRAAMNATAMDLGPAGYDTTYGHGLVDACAAVAAVGGDC